MTAPSIVVADGRHTTAVADLIAEAFTPLEVAAWLVGDLAVRTGVLRADFGILVAHAIAHGTVHLTPELTAAGVWYPREDGAPPPPVGYDARLATACGPHTDRFRALDAAFDAHHPDRPHHHLALLAVHPQHQGRGLGSALLDHYHRHRLDPHGLAAYLAASSPRARNLYTRHGYQAGEPFHLPDHGPPLWPMWRDPDPPLPA